MSDSAEEQVECVGSLLVHSSDLQELSSSSSPKTECVGSMLVQSSDMQELSDSSPNPHFPDMHLPAINLQKRVTVGTLLVQQDDLETHHNKKQDEPDHSSSA